jgi:adenine-specific DNA methylase
MSDARRLIEDFLPIQAISEEASREKSVRKGHISTLHLWWARRPLVACRAAFYTTMVAEGFPQGRIERVGHLKSGFDIRAQKIADEATGEVFVKRVEVKGRLRGQPVRLTTNEWYKAQHLAETYWLCVVWDPLSDSPELVSIRNPAARLDHAKREIAAARFYEIPADAIEGMNIRGGRNDIFR